MNVCMVIRDCDTELIKYINDNIKSNRIPSNVFCCPIKGAIFGVAEFEESLKKWLHDCTKNVTYSDDNDVAWWQEIEKVSFALPYKMVNRFGKSSKSDYMRNMVEIEVFRQLMEGEIKQIRSMNDKNMSFPYIKHNDDYDKECIKSIVKRDYGKIHSLISKVTNSQPSNILQYFIHYCLPRKNNENFSKWLNGEYLYVLDDICSNRNRRVLAGPIAKIKAMRREKHNKLEKRNRNDKNDEKDENAGKNNELLEELLKHRQIGSYDFFRNCQSLLKFVGYYKEHHSEEWDLILDNIKNQLKTFDIGVKLFTRYNFLQGTPVEFADGSYSRMTDDLIDFVFGGAMDGITSKDNNNDSKEDNDDISNKRVVSIAVAGPLASGKSTLLRRLFGIDARASAGRTTKGINCCRIGTNNTELILVDTEGIGAIELAQDQQTERKRDNKIILGALASSRVFLLNIMRDAKVARLLDVILWAYDKLKLGQKGVKNSVILNLCL